jgi:hypothetical protein
MLVCVCEDGSSHKDLAYYTVKATSFRYHTYAATQCNPLLVSLRLPQLHNVIHSGLVRATFDSYLR